MAEAVGRCMICRAPCMASDWLCQGCYREYPELRQAFAKWPAWARGLKRMHQAEREAERGRIETLVKVRGKDEHRTYSEYDTADLGLLPDFDEDEDAECSGRYPSEMGDAAIETAWAAIADWRND